MTTTFGSYSHLEDPRKPKELYNAGDVTGFTDDETDISPEEEIQELQILSKEADIPLEEILHPENVNMVAETINTGLKVLEDVKVLQKKIKSGKHDEVVLQRLEAPLQVLKDQYAMILEILSLKKGRENENPQEIEQIKKKYEKLGVFAIPFNHRDDICFNMLSHCLNLSSTILLRDIKITVERFLKLHRNSLVDDLSILISKLETLCGLLPFAATFDKSDIFSLDPSHPSWERLHNCVQVKTLAPTHVMQKSYQRFLRSFSIGVSLLARGSAHKNFFVRAGSTAAGAVFDFFAHKNTQRRVNLFYSNPDQALAFKVWNLLDQKALLYIFKAAFPTVKHSRKIFIPRIYDTLTFNNVQAALAEKTLNTTLPIEMDKAEILLTEKPQKLSFSYKDLRKPDKEKVPLRILSSHPLPCTATGFLQQKAGIHRTQTINLDISDHSKLDQVNVACYDVFKEIKEGLQHMQGSKLALKEVDTYFDGIILHIHGGGFVAMSSASHQAYTRQWAKKVGSAVLSVDYRLAPDFPYPDALDDCWQTYNWVLEHMEHTLGIKPTKIILAGDSAGGNLALGVTLLAIKNNVRVPDGLMLAYPALKMEVKTYSPSLILALNDQILPYSVLKMIPGVYIPPEGKPDKDPLLSPLKATDDLLKHLPPVRMMVGDRDPFHDDCWRFVDKLKKLDRDVSMVVYKDMTHGFLGYAFPGGMNIAKKCVRDSIEMLKELLTRKNEE